MSAAANVRPTEDEPMDEDEEDAQAQAAALDAWEREYADERSWETLQEDETGLLMAVEPSNKQRAKRQRLLSAAKSARVRRGMIRYLYVVLDLSRATLMTDLRPSRLAVLSNLVQVFVREFFDQNPLSQLGLVLARNGIAERITELSGSPEMHIAALREQLEAGGDMSLQNALEVVRPPLASVPTYGTREVLFLMSALSTCDPGDIFAAIGACKKSKIKCSVIGMSAEMHVCKSVAESTGGSYTVAADVHHLEEMMMTFACPPPSLQEETPSSLVNMKGLKSRSLGPYDARRHHMDTTMWNDREGFPGRSRAGHGKTMCACHREETAGPHYMCPRCSNRVCDLPTACPICALTLVSSPHLARSYHHLFPVTPFVEIASPSSADAQCFSCQSPLYNSSVAGAAAVRQDIVLECTKCKQAFCAECDMYIHETLHNCPGCEMGATVG